MKSRGAFMAPALVAAKDGTMNGTALVLALWLLVDLKLNR